MKKLSYYYYRFLAEIANPKNEQLRTLKRRIFGISSPLRPRYMGGKSTGLLTYVIDFDSFPYSFNICELLLLAEVKVNRDKTLGYRLVFNKESSEQKVLNNLKGANWVAIEENNKLQFWNKIVGCLALSPSLRDFAIFSNRSMYKRLGWDPLEPRMYDHVYHKQPLDLFELYTLPEDEINLASLHAPSAMLDLAERYFATRSCEGLRVTIVLRIQEWDPPRNSNLIEWKKAALLMQSRGACVTIIPDSDYVFSDNLTSVEAIVFRDPCWDIKLRMAVYEKSDIVVGTHGGALALASFSKSTRVMAFNRYPDGSVVNDPSITDRLAHRPGRLSGHLMPFYKDQSYIEQDTCANIVTKIEDFLEKENMSLGRR